VRRASISLSVCSLLHICYNLLFRPNGLQLAPKSHPFPPGRPHNRVHTRTQHEPLKRSNLQLACIFWVSAPLSIFASLSRVFSKPALFAHCHPPWRTTNSLPPSWHLPPSESLKCLSRYLETSLLSDLMAVMTLKHQIRPLRSLSCRLRPITRPVASVVHESTWITSKRVIMPFLRPCLPLRSQCHPALRQPEQNMVWRPTLPCHPSRFRSINPDQPSSTPSQIPHPARD